MSQNKESEQEVMTEREEREDVREECGRAEERCVRALERRQDPAGSRAGWGIHCQIHQHTWLAFSLASLTDTKGFFSPPD